MEEDNTQTNLIINYLPQSLTDEEFHSMFLSIGPIKSYKIVRDKSTGYSYGFGFVDYQNADDANRAIATLNGLTLQNKRVKVAYARPNDETIKGANLYVRNLPKHFREEELEDLFRGYGSIIQSRVLVDQTTGISKRVGFLLFDKRNEAEQAMNDMNGKTPPGEEDALMIKFADDNSKKVRQPAVQNQQHFPPQPRYPYPGAHGPMRTPGNRFRYNPMSGTNNYTTPNSGMSVSQGGYILFVYNIGYDADEKTLWQLFAPLGTVQKVNVIMDHQKNQCKGYGFVTMTNFREAQNAVNCLNGFVFNGRALSVSFKTSQNQQTSY